MLAVKITVLINCVKWRKVFSVRWSRNRYSQGSNSFVKVNWYQYFHQGYPLHFPCRVRVLNQRMDSWDNQYFSFAHFSAQSRHQILTFFSINPSLWFVKKKNKEELTYLWNNETTFETPIVYEWSFKNDNTMVRGKYLSTLRHALIIIGTVCISNIVPGWVISVYITCLIVIEEWNFVLGVGFCDPAYLEQFFQGNIWSKCL